VHGPDENVHVLRVNQAVGRNETGIRSKGAMLSALTLEGFARSRRPLSGKLLRGLQRSRHGPSTRTQASPILRQRARWRGNHTTTGANKPYENGSH